MAVGLIAKPKVREIVPYGPRDAGIPMRLDEFEEAEFELGWRYKIIRSSSNQKFTCSALLSLQLQVPAAIGLEAFRRSGLRPSCQPLAA